MTKIFLILVSIIFFLLLNAAGANAGHDYVGSGGCGCHRAELSDWKMSKHARAFELLKAGKKRSSKKKAGLDPDKDYTRDEKCVKCHVVGYQKTTGFKDIDSTRNMSGVGCEMCHGAGSKYRIIHRKKGLTFTKDEVIEAGQTYASIDESVCKQCHEHEDTPFQPKVDQRYALNYQEALKDGRSFHGIYPLKGNH